MATNRQYIDSRFNPYYQSNDRLWLFNKQFTSEDIYYLATHRDITQIKKLQIYGCKFQHLALLQLGRCDWGNLSSLDISVWLRQLSNHECLQLAQIQAPKLTDIKFYGMFIGAEGLLALTEAWPKIQKIDFEWNKIGDEGCHYLVKSNWNLISVRLVNNQIGAYGVKSLLKSQWNNLTKLQLSNNKIGDTGCKYLSTAQLKNLKSLYIYRIGIMKAGCKWLSKAHWKSLKKIRFGQDFISWQGCRYLSNLRLLKLNDAIITQLGRYIHLKKEDEGLFYLMKSNWKLTHFSMRGHRFENPKHIQQIYGKSFPKVRFFA